jgi:hypothetical protein
MHLIGFKKYPERGLAGIVPLMKDSSGRGVRRLRAAPGQARKSARRTSISLSFEIDYPQEEYPTPPPLARW